MTPSWADFIIRMGMSDGDEKKKKSVRPLAEWLARMIPRAKEAWFFETLFLEKIREGQLYFYK